MTQKFVKYDTVTNKWVLSNVVSISGAQGAPGVDGSDAFTTVSDVSYTQPAVSSNVTVNVIDSTWVSIGQIIYVTGGGYYQVISKPASTSVEIKNLGYSGNAAPAASVSGGPSTTVSAGGLVGATGTNGTNGTNGTSGVDAFTTVSDASYTQPAVNSNVTINVASSVWMGVDQVIYVFGGGHYQVVSKPTSTSVQMKNLGYTGNAAPAATVTGAGASINPAGIKGFENPITGDIVFEKEIDHFISVENSLTLSADGGDLGIYAATGTDAIGAIAGGGGSITIEGGYGGAGDTGFAAGNATGMTLRGGGGGTGASDQISGNGGQLSFYGGNSGSNGGFGRGTGGGFYALGGTGSSGGNMTLQGGLSSAADGGMVNLTGGNGGPAVAGNNNGYIGGQVRLISGNGGAGDIGQVAGAGGNVLIQGGVGGNDSVIAGNGGDGYFCGGVAGANSSATGGNVYIQSGDGAAYSNSNSGNISIRAGTPTGSGSRGNIFVGDGYQPSNVTVNAFTSLIFNRNNIPAESIIDGYDGYGYVDGYHDGYFQNAVELQTNTIFRVKSGATNSTISLPNNATNKFYIEHTVVESSVSALNLNKLTNGSDASALHYHAAPPAPTNLVYQILAATGLTADAACGIINDAGASKADFTDPTTAFTGYSYNFVGHVDSIDGSNFAYLTTFGYTSTATANFTGTVPTAASVGEPFYLSSTSGKYSLDQITGTGNWSQQVGILAEYFGSVVAIHVQPMPGTIL